jgi:hypothetical protein
VLGVLVVCGDTTYCDKLRTSFEPYDALHDHVEGQTIPTPDFYPVCDVAVLPLCPQYGFPIVGSASQRPIAPSHVQCRFEIYLSECQREEET